MLQHELHHSRSLRGSAPEPNVAVSSDNYGTMNRQYPSGFARGLLSEPK